MSHEDSLEPQTEPPKSKLCINCKHIGTNGSYNAELYRCFAPENKLAEPDLVTGEDRYFWLTCYLARGYELTGNKTRFSSASDSSGSCGLDGKWFEQADPRPKTVIAGIRQITTRPVNADHLLQELEGL